MKRKGEESEEHIREGEGEKRGRKRKKEEIGEERMVNIISEKGREEKRRQRKKRKH